MATREEELISEAMISTDKEIFNHAWGQEDDDGVLDESGDRSPEQMRDDTLEGQQEPDEDETEPDGEDEAPEGEDESEGDEQQGEEQGEEGEEGEGEDEAEAEEDAEAEPEAAAPPKPEAKPEGRVPSGRLREQTERADKAEQALRALQAERDSERQSTHGEIDGLRRQFDALTAALQGRQAAPQGAPQAGLPQQPFADAPPDQFENPQGYTEWLI